MRRMHLIIVLLSFLNVTVKDSFGLYQSDLFFNLNDKAACSDCSRTAANQPCTVYHLSHCPDYLQTKIILSKNNWSVPGQAYSLSMSGNISKLTVSWNIPDMNYQYLEGFYLEVSKAGQKICLLFDLRNASFTYSDVKNHPKAHISYSCFDRRFVTQNGIFQAYLRSIPFPPVVPDKGYPTTIFTFPKPTKKQLTILEVWQSNDARVNPLLTFVAMIGYSVVIFIVIVIFVIYIYCKRKNTEIILVASNAYGLYDTFLNVLVIYLKYSLGCKVEYITRQMINISDINFPPNVSTVLILLPNVYHQPDFDFIDACTAFCGSNNLSLGFIRLECSNCANQLSNKVFDLPWEISEIEKFIYGRGWVSKFPLRSSKEVRAKRELKDLVQRETANLFLTNFNPTSSFASPPSNMSSIDNVTILRGSA